MKYKYLYMFWINISRLYLRIYSKLLIDCGWIIYIRYSNEIKILKKRCGIKGELGFTTKNQITTNKQWKISKLILNRFLLIIIHNWKCKYILWQKLFKSIFVWICGGTFSVIWGLTEEFVNIWLTSHSIPRMIGNSLYEKE